MSNVPPSGLPGLPADGTTKRIAAPSGKRTIIATASLITSRLGGRAIDFIALLVLARLLTPADFGIVAVAMSLILIVEAVFELPVGQVLVVEADISRDMLDTAFTLSIIRGLLLAAIVGAAAVPFAKIYGDPRLMPLIYALAAAPAIRGIQNPGMIRYDRALDFKRQISTDIASKIASVVVSSLLAYTTHNYWALACGTILTPVLLLTFSFTLVPYRPRLTLIEWRLFRSFLGWLSAGQVISALTWQIDRLVLGWAISKPAVGRFTLADNLSALPSQILLTPIVGPLSISLSNVRHEERRLQANYLKLVSVVALIGFPALTGLALLADPFVRVALGPEWGDAGSILRLLALSNIPGLLWTPFNTLALATKRSWLIFSRQLIDLAVKVPTAISLILVYGVIGACIARCIATTVIGVASLLAARKVIAVRVRDQLDAIARPAIASAIMVALLFWPVRHLPEGISIPVLILLTFCLAVAGALIYIFVVATFWQLSGRPTSGESFVYGYVEKLMQGGW